MNTRFVVRGVLLALPLALVLLAAGVWLQTPFGRPPPPTPRPPTIEAPAGPQPGGPVGLRAWARYEGEPARPVGSGFLLQLPDGPVIAVTAGHSFAPAYSGRPLATVALGIGESPNFVAELDTLWAPPGPLRTGDDLSVDHLLLAVDGTVDPALILAPDPRGRPQPGERVIFYSGVGTAWDRPRPLPGTVISSSDEAVWVLVDEVVDPSHMSGSPLLSAHTGRVVGMTLVGSPRRSALLLGASPIDALVSHAAGSPTPRPLIDWDRGG
jgi:hypothetical protein